MMNPTPKRQIIIVGVLGALLSLVTMLPGLILLMLVMPIPYIHLTYKYGHSAGRQAILLTALLNGVVFNIQGVVLTLITFGLVAVALGGAFHEQYKPKTTVMISVGAAVASALLLYFFGIRIGFLSWMKTALEQHAIWETALADSITPEMQRNLIDYMIAILPGMIVSFSILMGLVNYYLAAFYLRWKGHTIQRLKPFRNWRFPRWVGLAYLILWFLLQFVPPDVVTLNLLVISMGLLIGEGVALYLYYTDQWGIYSFIRYIILITLIAIPFFSVAFLIAGLVDNVFQLRGLRKKELT